MCSYYSPTAIEQQQRRNQLDQFSEYNQRALLAIWSVVSGKPATYLDVGCGAGTMVKLARDCGVTAVGVDTIAQPPDIPVDLRQPLNIQSRAGMNAQFDLVTCIEVAEHLPDQYVDVLADSIARHLKEGGFLVFTAAIPGQQGDYHVNCQQPIYWRQKFWDRKVNYDPDLTRQLMFMWYQSSVTGPLMHLPANVQVFRKQAKEDGKA